MVYKLKEGSRISADPQKIGEELESIEQRDAATVVAVAKRNKKSELHKCFIWDDAIAGQEYRLEQARHLMRMIVTEVECGKGHNAKILNIRAFESVKIYDAKGESKKHMVYVSILQALDDDDYREQIMSGLEETIMQAEKTAENYSYLAPQFLKTKQKLSEARETVRA